MATPTAIVGYLALFTAFGLVFLFVNLLVGRFLRPHAPNPEKLEIYECGEPTIGSAFVQFDLRYYVVALVFLVFDVEVAFLFPLATVHGKAVQVTQLAESANPNHQVVVTGADGTPALSVDAQKLYRELGVAGETVAEGKVLNAETVSEGSEKLAQIAFWAICDFFVVLLVGFAYVWKAGAFDWVRVVSRERAEQFQRPPPGVITEKQPVLSV